MAAAYRLRQLKWRFKLRLAQWLLGDKATAPHFAWAGSGSSTQLCARIAESGHENILVVTDKPLRELGIMDRALASINLQTTNVHVFDGVEPDPTFSQAAEGTALFKAHNCSAVLAVGGGSSMDAAKIIALAAVNDDDPRGWVGLNKAPEKGVPIYAIPTTAGTGSEATMGAVITDDTDHSKQIISGLALLPRAVALDPELMLSLPPGITAATGLDALTHGIEAYIGIWERGSRSETALMAVKGVFRWLPQVMAEPHNLRAREGMALAAYYGGVAINQVNVGNVHAIAHQLGARYGIPHGVANAMVLTEVLAIYGSAAATKLEALASAIGLPEATADSFIEAIGALRASVGLPSEHEAILRHDIPAMAEAAIVESDDYFSPRLLTVDEMSTILTSICAAH